jgi:hypothetical protein
VPAAAALQTTEVVTRERGNELTFTMGERAPFSPCGMASNTNAETVPGRKGSAWSLRIGNSRSRDLFHVLAVLHFHDAGRDLDHPNGNPAEQTDGGFVGREKMRARVFTCAM